MEQLKEKKLTMPLRSAFIIHVLTTFLFVVAFSSIAIWVCFSVRQGLLPKTDEVFLNMEQTYVDGQKTTSSTRIKIGSAPESASSMIGDSNEMEKTGTVKYSVTSVEDGWTRLTPKRRLLYRGCGVAMIALPVMFSLTGILLCGFSFYKRKLKKPIQILSEATDQISKQNLDFQISYPGGDELGQLCDSFEQMRSALQKNNRRMWEMLDERRRLQASVAHDLRNPIAIIKGHAEYLRLNMPARQFDTEKILSITGNIESAAERLERYTDSIRELGRLEEIEPDLCEIEFQQLYKELMEDFLRMAAVHEIQIHFENRVQHQKLRLDAQILYRILENLISNALRYAENQIELSFSDDEQELTVCLSDDGPGFPAKVLKSKEEYSFYTSDGGLHSGMGLTICRILCKKHGGSLSLHNSEKKGAAVVFTLAL